MKIKNFLLLLWICWLPTVAIAADDHLRLTGAIQVHTTFDGSGVNSVGQLVDLARQRDLDFIVPTDHDLQVMEYGIFPLENLIKRREERDSVLKNGPEKYLGAIAAANRRQTDVVVIPGVQSSPFYYWEGSPFGQGLTAYNYRKEMLLIGMDNPQAYRDLPLMHRGFSTQYTRVLWPRIVPFAIAFLISIYLLAQRGLVRWFGAIICIFSIALAVNHHPFRSSLFDPYHGDQGVAPFQELIDYVDRHGGLTFWAHPESNYAAEKVKLGPVHLRTRHYPEDLIRSTGYTGFEAIYGDTSTVIDPGKHWDRVNLAYCAGKRDRPVWGIAGADFHGEASDDALDTYQTVVLAGTRTAAGILDALSKGRCYAALKIRESALMLDRFRLVDDSNGNRAVMGEDLAAAGPARLEAKISTADGGHHPVTVSLIRAGEVLETLEGETPLTIDYVDPGGWTGRTFYRLDVKMKTGNRLLSNPIFLSKDRE